MTQIPYTMLAGTGVCSILLNADSSIVFQGLFYRMDGVYTKQSLLRAQLAFTAAARGSGGFPNVVED